MEEVRANKGKREFEHRYMLCFSDKGCFLDSFQSPNCLYGIAPPIFAINAAYFMPYSPFFGGG